MTAIALIAGFALGAACAVALGLGLGRSPLPLRRHPPLEREGGEWIGASATAAFHECAGNVPINKQWENLWNYNGAPQNSEGGNGNGNQD